MKLLSPIESNAKTRKDSERFEGCILYLAPANTAGCGNVCPWSTEGCRARCLYTAGRGVINHVKHARMERTYLFMKHRKDFLKQLNHELTLLVARAAKKNKRAVCRLNGTSDIAWEKFGIPQNHPSIQFYDYTKSPKRAMAQRKDSEWPQNYHLDYSATEYDSRDTITRMALYWKINVAIPFHTIPKNYFGVRVINGDKSDWRFEDPTGVIVGLTPKGKAKHDTTGFVRFAQ